MPYYDLNVPYVTDTAELASTLSFLAELNYTHVAVNHHITDLKSLPALPLPPLPSIPSLGDGDGTLTVLRRCTVHLTPSTMPLFHSRLSQLLSIFSVLSVRPTDEKTFMAACTSLPPSLISLDLGSRLPFHFNSKHSTLSAAVKRGCRFEISYALGTTSSSVLIPSQTQPGTGTVGCTVASVSSSELAMARRNLIGNATGLIRALRKGRGIVISSGAGTAVACRAPADIVNLACVWGLATDRGWEAVGRTGVGEYLEAEKGRREGWRGAINIVEPGEKPAVAASGGQANPKQKQKQKQNPKQPAQGQPKANRKLAQPLKPTALGPDLKRPVPVDADSPREKTHQPLRKKPKNEQQKKGNVSAGPASKAGAQVPPQGENITID